MRLTIPTLPERSRPAQVCRPRAFRAIRIGLQIYWDNAGVLTALNLACFAAAVLLAWIPALLGPRLVNHAFQLFILAAGIAVLGALAAGPARVLALRLRMEPAGLAEVIEGIRTLGVRYIVITFAAVLLTGEALFYSRWLASAAPILCPLPLYVAAFWLAAMPYQYSLVAIENRKLGDAIRRSCLLVLDNPLYSLAAAALGGALVLGLTLTGVGLGMAALAVALSLGQASAVEVMRKYHIDPDYDAWYPGDVADD